MIVILKTRRCGIEVFEVTEAGILISTHMSEGGARMAAYQLGEEIHI